jgi:hypothetical protein
MEQTPKCICGKKRKIKVDGKLGETCGNRSCAGKLAKKHMQTVMQTRSVCWIEPRPYISTWD